MSKVLIVEDTEVNRLVLKHRLVKLGHEVVEAVDGEQALASATSDPPDIVLLDLYLPVMDGTEVARRLKEDQRTKDVPIIALTAHAFTKSRDEMVAAGCDEYETKPIDFARLSKKIDQLIGRKPSE